MVNEATNITLLGNKGDPVEYLIGTSGVVAKGSLMYIAETPAVVRVTHLGSQFFAGVAANEHVSGASIFSGSPDVLACWTHLLCDLKAGSATGDAMVLGAPVCTSESANNTVGAATNNNVEGMAMVVGVAQETVGLNSTGAVKINVGKSW